jgi:hypothetical protein
MADMWTERTVLGMTSDELGALTEGMIMHRLTTLNMVRQASYSITKRSDVNAAILVLTDELDRRRASYQ